MLTGIFLIPFICFPIGPSSMPSPCPEAPVYVGEGLVDLMTSEDELASVLGHEIEHIDHYHCAERVQVEARLRNLRLGVIGALVQIPLSVCGEPSRGQAEAAHDATSSARVHRLPVPPPSRPLLWERVRQCGRRSRLRLHRTGSPTAGTPAPSAAAAVPEKCSAQARPRACTLQS